MTTAIIVFNRNINVNNSRRICIIVAHKPTTCRMLLSVYTSGSGLIPESCMKFDELFAIPPY